ncbi:hypothetical protein [Helicobacter sp. 13S00477-4]|uniref:hypothetical protein n=1 Tax=Helicobacter sp. 13S00477-4 TaxID=1905759 RepID=UPI000BA75AA3|nr:hypothetical protein [Helicobacter sp. 13S00477-4]PAF50511.1 hypothetical protein BKH44_07935 [Helicobacter sp. 13S00477-4]
MSLSFLSPKPKYIFTKITKIWIFYIFLSLFIVFGFLFVLKYQIFLSSARVQDYKQKQANYQDEIMKFQNYKNRILAEVDLLKDRETHNLMVRDAIGNLFNIIPDQITIDYIEVGNKTLIIKGSTPSKEVFKFLLQDPLKAIFGKSTVSFFALTSGWFNFVSKSESNTSIIDIPKGANQ